MQHFQNVKIPRNSFAQICEKLNQPRLPTDGMYAHICSSLTNPPPDPTLCPSNLPSQTPLVVPPPASPTTRLPPTLSSPTPPTPLLIPTCLCNSNPTFPSKLPRFASPRLASVRPLAFTPALPLRRPFSTCPTRPRRAPVLPPAARRAGARARRSRSRSRSCASYGCYASRRACKQRKAAFSQSLSAY